MLDPRKRKEFVNTRCFLRQILGRRLELPPGQVRLQPSSRGKLACEQLRDHAFSVSHSHGVSVIAIAPCAAVGVDVERVIERATMAQLAIRFFSEHEYRSWAAVAGAQRTAAFYDLWTRKEAYLKALGTGLFDGSAKANSTVPLCTESLEDGAADRSMPDWHWRNLELPNGYRGAVCWIASS